MVLFLLLFGCRTKIIVGKYITNGSYNNDIMILREDSTFNYKSNSHISSKSTITGIWRLHYDTLHLNVLFPPKARSLNKGDTCIERKMLRNNVDMRCFKIYTQDSLQAAYLFDIYLDNDTVPIEKKDSTFFVYKPFKFLHVTFPNMNDKFFNIKSSSSNDFRIFIYDNIFIPMSYLSVPRRLLLNNHKEFIPIMNDGVLGSNTKYTRIKG